MVTALESNLADAQELAQEETRVKLSLQSQVRQAEDRLDAMQDALEEEESNKRALENKIATLAAQVKYI